VKKCSGQCKWCDGCDGSGERQVGGDEKDAKFFTNHGHGNVVWRQSACVGEKLGLSGVGEADFFEAFFADGACDEGNVGVFQANFYCVVEA